MEDLLDAIPARIKAVFIDACHAGEADASAVAALKPGTLPMEQSLSAPGNHVLGENGTVQYRADEKACSLG